MSEVIKPQGSQKFTLGSATLGPEEAVESPIEQRAQANIGVTFNALRKSALFGTSAIHAKRDFVKFKLFSTVAEPAAEETFYNPVVLEYAGKAMALQLIPAGMDYWGSQARSVTTKGTDEQVSFLDRVKMLLELQKRFWAELNELQPLVETYIKIKPLTKGRPRVGPEGSDKAVDPQKFPETFPPYEVFPGEHSSWGERVSWM